MKKFMLFLVLFISCLCSYSQPMLSKTKAEVLSMLNNKDNLFKKEEGISDSGVPYISAIDNSATFEMWYFKKGRVDQYRLAVTANIVSSVINNMDYNFTPWDKNEWYDYSTGTKIYYHLVKKNAEFYYMIATLYDINN